MVEQRLRTNALKPKGTDLSDKHLEMLKATLKMSTQSISEKCFDMLIDSGRLNCAVEDELIFYAMFS